jgi:hypothetical protein
VSPITQADVQHELDRLRHNSVRSAWSPRTLLASRSLLDAPESPAGTRHQRSPHAAIHPRSPVDGCQGA